MSTQYKIPAEQDIIDMISEQCEAYDVNLSQAIETMMLSQMKGRRFNNFYPFALPKHAQRLNLRTSNPYILNKLKELTATTGRSEVEVIYTLLRLSVVKTENIHVLYA